MKKYKKGAFFTDIHIGAKSNSIQHNEDCLEYIKWFCDNVNEEGDIDYICFLGDWHEVRNNIDINTLNYSYKIAKEINNLNLPVYFLLGNHDLYYRNKRDIHSLIMFKPFKNFILIEEPTIINNIGDGVLMAPYLFHEEYSDLVKYKDIPIWFGHFEFKDFIVTGYNITMKHGPDHNLFKKQKYIFSGHFHKRQQKNNVVYIGNTFPTNFADADDNDRGMMIFNHDNNKITFKNWEDAPTYKKVKLSELINNEILLKEKSRVKCVVDIPLNYEESIDLRSTFMEKYNLREFTLEESSEINETLTENSVEVSTDSLKDLDEMVVEMLNNIESEHIDNKLLTEIYKQI